MSSLLLWCLCIGMGYIVLAFLISFLLPRATWLNSRLMRIFLGPLVILEAFLAPVLNWAGVKPLLWVLRKTEGFLEARNLSPGWLSNAIYNLETLSLNLEVI